MQRYLERELALQPPPNIPDRPRRTSRDQHFSEQERREMTEIVQRLCRRMRGARSYRRQISHRGRISVPLTLRRNMKYEGIPFQPVMTDYRNERPRLAVICDVSLSVRNTARFMLHLVYNLQNLFGQVRSFAFVSDLVEVSAYFDRLSIDEAITTVFDGDLLDTEVDSNYGHALTLFHNRHLAAVTRQTSVIILGDGRGNRNPPQVWVLEAIRRRAKQLLWLSPEPRGSWQMGSCDMALYEPVCHQTEVVRNLQQLGRVTEDLLRRSVTRH
ncbi:MAG: VWA domain-containing protein [Gammaproteobacteria bacterium]|nr:VWA domain-containing protein [Gammaproteobacteria bacterium]